MSIDNKKVRPFLKWAGGKFELVEKIKDYLPEAQVLIEPFVGAGAVFLNTNYKRYILNDINIDLITLYKTIQEEGDSFIREARKLFGEKYNNEKKYYSLRNKFNTTHDVSEKSLIFLYLNKHGYNGLCRYNKSGKFNVPFGRHKLPSFPQESLELFFEKSKRAKFVCENFTKTFSRARTNHVIYCDPPYAPLSKTANFSDYASSGFRENEQILLADKARSAAARGIHVVISNHNTPFVRKIYKGASIVRFKVRRHISCDSENRAKANELLAIFMPE